VEITLSREQFAILLELVYLGNWMANAIRMPGEEITDLSHLEQHLFALARDRGLDDIADLDETLPGAFPSQALEDRMELYIEEYDDQVFWDQLTDRLAERDMLEEHGEPAVRAMSQEEYFERRDAYVAKYEEEATNHGIERLRVIP
jgi:hypothetical protein